MFNVAEMQEQSRVEAEAITSGGSSKGRDERLVNMNETNTILFKIVPDVSRGVKRARLNAPFSVLNFKGIDGKNHYAGTHPVAHPVKELKREKDVVAEKRTSLWETDEDSAKKLFPQERAYFNVYIIKDKAHPENDGTWRVISTGYKPKRFNKDGSLVPNSGTKFRNFYDSLLKKDGSNDDDFRRTYDTRDIHSMSVDTNLIIKLEISKPEDGSKPPEYTFLENFREGECQFDVNNIEELVKLFEENTHNLEEMIDPPKSDEEILNLIDKYVLGISNSNGVAVPDMDDPLSDAEEINNKAHVDEDDDIPMVHDKKEDDGDLSPDKLDDFLDSIKTS